MATYHWGTCHCCGWRHRLHRSVRQWMRTGFYGLCEDCRDDLTPGAGSPFEEDRP
jgi:hypothetical protein